MHYFTDLPTIASGNRLGFFEPQMRIWRESGKSRKLSTVQKSCPNHLQPFDGIGDFDSSSDFYPKTLFRFPLRTKKSPLSDTTYTPDMLLELLDALRYEAKYLLLFLRSLEQIVVYTISRAHKKSIIFQVEVDRDDRDDLRRKRIYLGEMLKKIYVQDKKYGIAEQLYFTSNFTINIRSNQSGKCITQSTKWIISNLVGSDKDDVRRAAEEVNAFPTVGTALELESEFSNEGRIFCFLPLPSEACTVLPVHINGTFSLEDNRRDLKWPSRERRGDSAANWNVLLVNKVLPICYDMLLKKALEILKNDPLMFYQAIPNACTVKGTKWEGLLKPLYFNLFKTYACFCSLSKEWVMLEDATFIPEETSVEMTSDVVYKVMQDRAYNLVELPYEIWQALRHADLMKDLTELSPNLVRLVLKRDKWQNYTKLSNSEKLQLLFYCLSDGEYSELCGLRLVPLADGHFECFQLRGLPVYVCTKECFLDLLPSAHDKVISVFEITNLQTMLQDVAVTRETQLRLLEPHVVADLLATKCYPVHISNTTLEVCVHDLGFPEDWFRIFWNWVRDKNLGLFQDLHVVPTETEPFLKLRKLAQGGGMLLVERNQSYASDIVEVLTKFNVKCILQENVPYIKHKCIFEYLQPFNYVGALKAIQEANFNDLTNIQSVLISSEEANNFQAFIRNVPTRMGYLVSFLPIFQVVGHHHKPMAINNGETIFEPAGNVIAPNYLPSNFTLLSRTKNIRSVVDACRTISCPQSLVQFVQEFVFPLIRVGKFHPSENITPFMEEVLKIFANLESQSQQGMFVDSVEKLPFIRTTETSNECKCPNELFDPSSKELRSLFEGKAVFPLFPFNNETYLVHLRKCGLKRWVNAQDIYDILLDISEVSHLRQVDEVDLHRSQYVFEYLKHNEALLSDSVNVGSYYCIELGQAIYSLAKKKSIFAIENQPSASYPKCILWKGSHFPSHLTTINDSVMPLSSSSFDIQSIVGSEMYIIYCPSPLCSILRSDPPIRQVISHFMMLINHKNEITSTELTKLSMQTYRYLQDHIQEVKETCDDFVFDMWEEEWVWVEELHKFFTPHNVTFSGHETFHHKLSPYIYLLPRSYATYKTLLTYFGGHIDITDALLVSILQKIKADECTDMTIRWKLVRTILDWVTDNGTMHAMEKVDLDMLLVPVEQPGSTLQLEKVKDVVYADNTYIKQFSQHKNKTLRFIHSKFEHLSKFLGVIPMSKELNISEDVFEDVGQNEPLVIKIKNILRDYSGGLTIIKELLQNADDAEATEVNICYDARKHTQNSSNLCFPGMARAHGPALIVHNN